MTAKRRCPSERKRALWALQGFYVPAVGTEGAWKGLDGDEWISLRVRVARVSATGKTLWVRFLEKPAPRETRPQQRTRDSLLGRGRRRATSLDDEQPCIRYQSARTARASGHAWSCPSGGYVSFGNR